MWPRTDFLELIGIARPVIQAPMSGFAPPALAAAVCNAGALRSIGCAGVPPATVRQQVIALRQATNHPYNLNFFCPPASTPRPGGDRPYAGEACDLFRRIWDRCGSRA